MNRMNLLVLFLVLGALALTGCSEDCPVEVEAPPELDYAGSDKCLTCHADIHDKWANSGHPYKLTPIDGEAPTGTFPSFSAYGSAPIEPPAGTTWDDFSYTIGGYGWKMRWIQNDGYIYTPASGQNQWNFEPESFGDYHAGETKPYNCGACHTTGWVDSDDGDATNNQDGMEGFLGTFVYGGVHCERCHGKGNQHVFEPSSYELTIDSSSFFCGKCHTRGGDNGVTPETATIEAKGGFIKHHEQYDEWYNSGHNSSHGPGCVDCHDPHASTVFDADAPGEGVRASASCESCHVDGAYADIASTTHGFGSTCVDCHMPDASKSAYASNIYNGDVATHLWKINTSVEGKDAMFSEDGTSVLIEDGIASITLDFACYGCHQDEEGNGGTGTVKTLQELHDRAMTIHTYVDEKIIAKK